MIVLFCCLCISIHGNAQAETDTIVTLEKAVVDTTYVADAEEEDGQGPFIARAAGDSSTITERKLPNGYIDDVKKDGDFWYADGDVKKKQQKKENKEKREDEYVPLGQRQWVQTLLWLVIIAGFAGAIMWYLLESNVGIFRKKNLAIASDRSDDEIPEDIFAINYQREIDKAAAQSNYRLAVRLYYLRLLKNLADKGTIQYKQDRTNLDYLMQLQPTRFYNAFFRLTRHYEYSWYGHFDVEEPSYRIIAGEFDRFDREIR